MKTRIVGILMTLLLTLGSWAQGEDFVIRRGNCMPDVTDGAAAIRRAPHRLPTRNTEWDANKTYRQLVILLTFSDTDFSMVNPKDTYNSIFNEGGYNQRQGAGCVADYFRVQSGGLFNIQFDVYGPYQVDSKAQPYDNPTANTRNYGREPIREATQKFIAENPDMDFSPYDWNGDGRIEQVVYVYAGYAGNQNSQKVYGHIWPNTSTFATITTNDGKTISDYSSSGELWANESLCGIGTICHEFTHSLGLPDIYPTSSSAGTYSVLDEWDLMDGGNFTNFGWCPPNYTALEKYLMGWLSYTELKESATVNSMKPLSDGGEAYVVKHTDTEYLLLENRQWRGWDAGLPAKGLVIYHVNYVASSWAGNTVNNTADKPNFCLMNPEGKSYEEWSSWLKEQGITTQNGIYQNTDRMNNRIFSGTVYPYETVDALTDTSAPAATMYNTNAGGQTLLGKPITNIRQNADGTVSFDFMGGDPSAVEAVRSLPAGQQVLGIYDLAGRRVSLPLAGQLYVVKYTNGMTTVKYHKK